MSSLSRATNLPAAVPERAMLVSGNALAVSSMVFWAAGFPAAELLLDDWHPITLSLFRLLMALAVLLPLWILFDGLDKIRQVSWGWALWVGLVGFGIGTNLLLFAQWFTDPVTVTLIATTTPIAATTVEVLNRQRRLSSRFVLGLFASVAGGAVALGGSFSVDFGIGVLLAITAGFFFAWGSNAAVRDFPELSPVGRSAVTFCGAAVFTIGMFAVAWVWGGVALPRSITAEQLGLLSIYAVAAMALSQILFMASVARLGIALSSFHINIAPFYVMLILIALGGAWDWRAAAGAAIVGLGVLISQSRPRGPRAQERA